MNILQQAIIIFSAKMVAPSSMPKTEGMDVFNGIINLSYWVGGIAAVAAYVFAGVLFMTSSGDPAKAAKARTMIILTTIGLVVLITATSIAAWVRNAVMG